MTDRERLLKIADGLCKLSYNIYKGNVVWTGDDPDEFNKLRRMRAEIYEEIRDLILDACKEEGPHAS